MILMTMIVLMIMLLMVLTLIKAAGGEMILMTLLIMVTPMKISSAGGRRCWKRKNLEQEASSKKTMFVCLFTDIETFEYVCFLHALDMFFICFHVCGMFMYPKVSFLGRCMFETWWFSNLYSYFLLLQCLLVCVHSSKNVFSSS